MGRGSSGAGGGGGLSQAQRDSITRGIVEHSSEDNDRAQRNIERALERETDILTKYNDYVKVGRIKNADDPWWQEHVETAHALQAQLDFFKKERKRIRR